MTLAERPIETLVCQHDQRAVCALCSDQDPRWKAWRVSMGLGEEPRRRRPLPPVLLAPSVPLPVIEEPRKIKTMSEGDWRKWYQRLYGKGRRS